MENLKSEPFDEKEEGEISLDDVSSSDETHYTNCNKKSKKSDIGKKYIKREVDILSQDADHGKENRRFSNEFIGTASKPVVPTLQEKNDDLLPISSEEDIEFVGLPGTSKQFAIHTGPKKKRKKKKKKSGQRMLVIDDLVSAFDDEPEVLGVVSDDHRDFIVSRSYGGINDRSPSPMHRMNSPPRHTGWHLSRSPTRHYHTPLKHGRLPIRRSPSPRQRSPRKFLSPRKSPGFNSDRRVSHKPPRGVSPERYNDAYASSLLKKVRHLETVGSITPVNQQKYKESSLKDKLSNMMIKSLPETIKNVDSRQFELGDSQNIGIKIDDEEDLEFLRRKALETTQLKNDRKSKEIYTTNVQSNVDINTNVSDDDEEDLELRMIALRSAVMKKHHDRVQRGQMKKKSGTDIKDESPFSDNFLDSLDGYLDGSAHVAYNENQTITSPIAQLSNAENAHVEDMDLDSDVEREKENSQPYSPTDELSPRTFIEPNFPDQSLTEPSLDQFPTQNIDENLTNIVMSPYSGSSSHHFNDHMANVVSPYSPSDATCIPKLENSSRQEPPMTTRDPRLRQHINSNTEIPYSSNDTSTFDPTLPVCPPEIPSARTQFNTHVNPRSSHSSNLIVVPLAKNPINPTDMILVPLNQSPSTLSLDSNVTTQLHVIQTINTKDTNAVFKKGQSDITYNDIIRDLAEYTGEPLYLQGVPDITKDANKIPTLVNRTLVPVPILKTNKQLQQPLPNKKPDGNGEPTFKSAEMLPVNVQTQSVKSSTVFKPIKLQSVTKKNQVMIPPAAAFNNSLNDDATIVLPNDRVSKIVENPDSASGNKCNEIPMNLRTSGASESVVVPGSVLKTKVRRPRTPRTKAETAENPQRRAGQSGPSIIVANEKVNNKITIKRNSKTTDNKSKSNQRKSNASAEHAKKSNVNAKKKDSVNKFGAKRGRRSKSVTRSEDKSDESLKNNSNVNKNSDDTTKQKKEISKKVSKTKTRKRSESNSKKANVANGDINKTMPIGADAKKRRSSVDEDEETLRAALLASLPKRMKTSDSQTTTTTSKSTIERAQSIKKASRDIKASLKEKQQSETTAMVSPVIISSQSGSKRKTSGQNIVTANIVGSISTAKKRLSTLNNQGPSKKIVKNTTASPINTAKILNVAEKIVDNEIQRRLAQQQAAIDLLFSKAQQNTRTILPRLNMKDSIASISPKISALKNLDRMIIRLGEDSDSDSDIDDETTRTKTKNINMSLKEANKAPTIPVTDFEKSVEEFLRSQREKQESSTNATAKSSSSTSSKETSPLTSTPLAVRHLPASKQEEYRRLKQCIAEREQQKINRTAQTTPKNHVPTTSSNEEPVTSSASTSIVITNDTISTVNMQTKVIIPSADETQKIALDPPYRPIAIQTQIAQSPLKLLQPKINTDITDDIVNNAISDPLLLTDIPIKTDPSLLDTTFNIVGDNQTNNIPISNRPHNDGVSDLNLVGLMRPNLTIRFANSRDDSVPCIRHVSMVGSDDIPKEQSSSTQVTPVGIRILTTDQLNMKYEHTQTDVIDNDMLISRSGSENIDTDPMDASITIESYKVETNRGIIDPSTLNYRPIIDSEPLALHIIKRNDCSPKHSNNDGLKTTNELDSAIVMESTTVINDIESISDLILNTPVNNRSTSLYNAQLSTASAFPVQQKQVKKHLEIFESNVQVPLETLYNLPEDQQRIQLTTIEKGLVAKRYAVLHNLTQMAEDLEQWEIQSNLAAEVERLQKELQMAEERLQVQRVKTMKMSPAVTQTHNTINQGRDECMKLMKLCQGIGSKVMGPAYKIPSTGGLLLKEKLREVANMTKQLSKNKVPSDLNEEQNSDTVAKLLSNSSWNKNSEFNLQSAHHSVETNLRSASVKIEKVNDSEITANMCDSSSNETLSNVPMKNDIHKTNEVIETKDNVTLFDFNNSPLDRQFVENMDNVDISIYDSSLLKIEDENLSMQPEVSYESVLTSLNTPRLNGLSSIADENTLVGGSSGDTYFSPMPIIHLTQDGVDAIVFSSVSPPHGSHLNNQQMLSRPYRLLADLWRLNYVELPTVSMYPCSRHSYYIHTLRAVQVSSIAFGAIFKYVRERGE